MKREKNTHNLTDTDCATLKLTTLRPACLPDETGFAAVELVPWQGDTDGPKSAALGQQVISMPQELAKAVPKRRLEFLSGRLCAVHAAEQLGLSLPPIEKGPRGEPLWPPGITGSISHSSSLACAVIAPSEENYHIGIDIEQTDRADKLIETAPLILTQAEQNHLPRGTAERNRSILENFCLKEAIYKAIYPIVQRFVEFSEVTVMRTPDGCWTMIAADPLHQLLIHWQMELHLETVSDHVLAVCMAKLQDSK